jgi:hypothetical protein
MESDYHRRTFFRKAANLVGGVLVAPYFMNLDAQNDPSKRESIDSSLTPHINPAFRMYCYKDGSVKLYTFQKSAPNISHSYSGLEVSLLLLIAGNKQIKANWEKIANRHSLSFSACKNRIDNAMNEFKSKGLIYYGEPVLVKNT